MAIIQGKYSSQADAGQKIPAALDAYYRTNYPAVWNSQRSQVTAAGKELAALYDQNVFPSMNVTWGTHQGDIGHKTLTQGCFRCHDGSHVAKDGKAISDDCSVCHNVVAMQDPNPQPLAELGMTQ